MTSARARLASHSNPLRAQASTHVSWSWAQTHASPGGGGVAGGAPGGGKAGGAAAATVMVKPRRETKPCSSM